MYYRSFPGWQYLYHNEQLVRQLVAGVLITRHWCQELVMFIIDIARWLVAEKQKEDSGNEQRMLERSDRCVEAGACWGIRANSEIQPARLNGIRWYSLCHSSAIQVKDTKHTARALQRNYCPQPAVHLRSYYIPCRVNVHLVLHFRSLLAERM